MVDIKTKDICKEIGKEVHLRFGQVEEVFQTFTIILCDHLAKGESVEIKDLALFEAPVSEPRKRRNPHTGENFMSAPKRTPKAKFRKFVKEQVNKDMPK